MKKRLLALLSAIVLMGSVSLAENTEESAETPATAEPMVSLPIDFSPGMPADPDGFTLGDGTWSYEDPLADIPADDEIDAAGFEPARDLLVVGIVKRDGLFFDGLDILDGVNGKLRGMAEMLHHFAILAGNCNFHSMFFLSGLLLRRQRLRSLL